MKFAKFKFKLGQLSIHEIEQPFTAPWTCMPTFRDEMCTHFIISRLLHGRRKMHNLSNFSQGYIFKGAKILKHHGLFCNSRSGACFLPTSTRQGVKFIHLTS